MLELKKPEDGNGYMLHLNDEVVGLLLPSKERADAWEVTATFGPDLPVWIDSEVTVTVESFDAAGRVAFGLAVVGRAAFQGDVPAESSNGWAIRVPMNGGHVVGQTTDVETAEFVSTVVAAVGQSVMEGGDNNGAGSDELVEACKYLAGLPDTHWTVQFPNEEDDEENEDRVRHLMDSESRELGVQLVEYVDGRYCYLDTHTGRIVCMASNGERMAARRVPPEVWDSVDRYYGGTGLGPMMVVR